MNRSLQSILYLENEMEELKKIAFSNLLPTRNTNTVSLCYCFPFLGGIHHVDTVHMTKKILGGLYAVDVESFTPLPATK